MIRRLAALALLLCACAPVQADEGAFRADMIKLFEGRYAGVTFAPGDEELVVKAKGGDWDGRIINLHRIFLFCQNATVEDCGTVKQDFLTSIVIKPADPTPASLRIIVRDQPYVDYLVRMETEAGKRLAVRRQIGEDLHALLVSDGPQTIATVNIETLADLGLSEAEAWQRAWRQTLVDLPIIPDPSKFKEQAIAFEAEQYLATLVADLSAWQKVSDAVGPNLFMTVVSDQFVFVGPMPDGPNLEAFRQTVEEDCRSQPRCVSSNIYRFRGGQWVIAR